METLAELDQRGFLTNSQVADLLFADRPNPQGALRTDTAAQAAANRTLRRLWHSGLVERVRVVLTSRRTGGPYVTFVNVLTVAGARIVRDSYEELGTDRSLRWTKGGGDLGYQGFEHAVAINDVYALAVRACAHGGVRIGGWRDDRQLAAMNRIGETHFVSVPDGFFALSAGGPVVGHFLELDRGTETVFGISERRRDWKAKIAGYEAYFRERYGAEALFEGIAAPVVLTVTTSAERLANLVAATRAAGGGARYWYTTLDALDPEDAPRGAAFWEPIWHLATEASPCSLLERVGPNFVS